MVAKNVFKSRLASKGAKMSRHALKEKKVKGTKLVSTGSSLQEALLAPPQSAAAQQAGDGTALGTQLGADGGPDVIQLYLQKLELGGGWTDGGIDAFRMEAW